MNATFLKIAAYPVLTVGGLLITGCSGGNDDSAAAQTGTVISAQGVTGGNCASLSNLKMVDTTVSSAALVTPPFTPPRGGAAVTQPFCRVVGVSNPTSDSTINFEVWLPSGETWNKKFFSGTGAGSTGLSQYGPWATGLAATYAAMSQDRGHVSRADLGVPLTTDGSWAAGHPEKIIDWGYRSQHVTTVASQGIIGAFDGSAPQRSYYSGCSAGGHVGTMQAQRYPEDYDGIIAGAPAWNWTNLLVGRLWSSVPSLKNPADALPAAKLTLLSRAVVAACDAIDGVTDGVIDDPRKCNYDPGPLQCTGADAPTCLTTGQVNTARLIYAGPKRPNGQQVYPGYTRGSEPLWTVNTGATPGGSSFDFFRYWVYENANYDSRTFNFDSDVDFTNNKLVSGQTMASVVNATPNIKAFNARGGKLLIWQGWDDEQVHSLGSIDYYDKVVAANTKAETDKFFRLFMMPGVAHCGGGPGPDTINTLTALERWVEQGIAPNQIIASKVTGGTVTRTRPLCPYPQVAKYNGTGSIDAAASFTCANP